MKTIFTITGLILMTGLTLFAQNAPTATNVSISGVNHVDAVLTGSYDYNDLDSDPESGTTFQWYRSGSPIGGANAITYTLAGADDGETITFEVTPDDGVDGPGTAVESAATDIVEDFADINYANNTTHNVSGREDYGSFVANNRLTVNIGNGDSLIIWLDFDVWNQTDIFVDPGGYFEVKGNLGANNNPEINIDGDLVVLGDLDVSQNAVFNIADGGSLDISGDFTAGDNAVIDIEGDVTVDGNFEVGTFAEITVDGSLPAGGTLVIGGDLTAGNNSTLLGDGDVTVGGTVTGPITGDEQLPVNLVSFTANFSENKITLNWTTAAELNNDYFTIERSSDGIHFETIIQTSGQGNSSVIVNYTEYDYNPLEGISYYRLKQTDFDGKFEYFKIIGVSTSLLKSENDVNVFPNPFSINNGLLNIQVNDFNTEENINIRVIDITGKVIYESTENSGSESFISTIQFKNNIPEGTYFVIISNNYNRQHISKLLIK